MNPIGGYHYRCSNGHWVGSSTNRTLAGTKCSAMFGTPEEIAAKVKPCHGELSEPMVDLEDWDILSDELEALRRRPRPRFEVVHAEHPIDGDSPFFYVQDHENYQRHHPRYDTREQAEAALAAADPPALREKALRWACWSWGHPHYATEPPCPTSEEFAIVQRSFGYEPWDVAPAEGENG